MEKKFSIAEAKNRLPALVHEAEDNQPIYILRRGKSVAVLLSAKEYERLLAKGTRGFWASLAGFRENVLPHSDEPVTDDDFRALRDRSPGREPAVD